MYNTTQTPRAYLAQTPPTEDVIAASNAHDVAVRHEILHAEDTTKNF